MKSKLVVSVLLAGLLAACSTAPQGDVAGSNEVFQAAAGQPIPGQYIVVMNRDLSRGAAKGAQAEGQFTAQSAEALSLEIASVSNELGIQALKPLEIISGFVAKLDKTKLAALRSDPRIAYVEQDQIVTASATQNDLQRYGIWGLDRIDDRSLPLDGSYQYNANGAGVWAFIIDTGIRESHEDFGGRVIGGKSYVSDGRGYNDCNGHGTHVAGTVGGKTVGVAKSVSLFAVRVLGCDGSGSNSGVIDGVNFVTKTAKDYQVPAVANMSLGGGVSKALDEAVKASINSGVSYAVAAGNESQNACNSSPARVPSAVTVGSSTRSDSRSSFSNFGSCVDIFAPGSDIFSTWIRSDNDANTISGTSMASPHVAGAIALILQGRPNASPATVSNVLTSAASNNKLSGIGQSSPNKLLYTGAR